MKPLARITSAGSVTRFLHSSQSRRARRWATTQSTAEPTRKGSMPISIRRVMAPGASLVCSVESTRWPVSAASMAICAVSRSRISPTMMMSGSARIIERRPAGEREAGLLVDLHLGEALELVLDRVLDRDDVLLDRVELVERRVERRRLARAGRAGHEHRAVGLAEGLGEALERLRQHAELSRADQRLATSPGCA